jgi:hypothetical protein
MSRNRIRPEKSASYRLAHRLGWIQEWMGVSQAQFCLVCAASCFRRLQMQNLLSRQDQTSAILSGGPDLLERMRMPKFQRMAQQYAKISKATCVVLGGR